MWFQQQFEEVANFTSLSEVKKKILFRRGTASQWMQSLDTRAYTELRTFFKNRYWSMKIQRQTINAMQSESNAASRDGSIEAYSLKWEIHTRFLQKKRSDQWAIEQLNLNFPQRMGGCYHMGSGPVIRTFRWKWFAREQLMEPERDRRKVEC